MRIKMSRINRHGVKNRIVRIFVHNRVWSIFQVELNAMSTKARRPSLWQLHYKMSSVSDSGSDLQITLTNNYTKHLPKYIWAMSWDFVLRKLVLQARIRSHPVGLAVWFLVGSFVYFNTSCVRTAKALARLRGCASSTEPSLVAYVISTIISWAGSFTELDINPHPL